MSCNPNNLALRVHQLEVENVNYRQLITHVFSKFTSYHESASVAGLLYAIMGDIKFLEDLLGNQLINDDIHLSKAIGTHLVRLRSFITNAKAFPGLFIDTYDDGLSAEDSINAGALISAAPDLLSSLEEMVKGDEEAIKEAEELGSPFQEDLMKPYLKAKAAIAKAKGGKINDAARIS